MPLHEPSGKYPEPPPRKAVDPSPIIDLPMSAIVGDSNSPNEVRKILEDLHRSARESRRHVQQLERENELLQQKLDTAALEARTAEHRERELSSRFVEITSVIKERDTALANSERYSREVTSLKNRLDAALREHEGAHRQHEAVLRQLGTLRQSAEANADQLKFVQSQVVSIRQARDHTQSLNRELSDKLAKANDQIADLEYARDTAEQSTKTALEQLAQLRQQLVTMGQDRDALIAQVAELSRENDASRQRILEIATERSTAQNFSEEEGQALTEARQQVTSITQEREAARQRAADLALELDGLRQQLDSLQQQAQSSQGSGAESEQLRRQLEALQLEKEDRSRQELELRAELDAQHDRLEELERQIREAQNTREESVLALAATEARMQAAMRDSEERQRAAEEKCQLLEEQISATKAKQSELQQALMEARCDISQERSRAEAANKRCDEHRMISSELNAQLETAKREILEFTAKLAEARLLVKFGKPEPEPAAAGEDFPAASDPMDAEESYEPLNDKDARNILLAMRGCHQAFVKSPGNHSLLNEFYTHAHLLAERAGTSGLLAVSRLSATLASLAEHLHDLPESITPSTLRTLHQTNEFLGSLVREHQLGFLKDPYKARVFALEGSQEAREAIGIGLQNIKLLCQHSSDPAATLSELDGERFSVLLLDIDLPGVKELCTEIRALPDYANTPIICLSAHDSLEKRAQASQCGGTDFLAKPLNLHELGVRILTLMLKAQIQT